MELPRRPDFRLRQDRKGRYYVRHFLGRDGTGKVKHWQYTCRSTTEATAMAEVLEEWAKRLGNPTFSTLSEQYLEACRNNKRAPSTVRAYRTRSKYLMPYIADTRVRNLTSGAVMDIYEDLLEQGRMRDGGELSPNTVILVHKHLKTFYKWCMARGYVVDNPMLAVVPPPKEPVEAHPLDDETLEALSARISRDLVLDNPHARAEAMGMYLALRCGVRVSEACGVRRRDVSFRLGQVSVVGQVKTDGGRVRWEKGTKSKKSRVIPIPEDVQDALKAYMERQSATFSAEASTTLVSADGSPMRPPELSAAFRVAMAACGAGDEYTFHCLRHTFATLLLQDGTPIQEVSALLGHANTSTTANIYAHVMPGRAQDAVARLGEIIRGVGGA